MGYLGAGIVFLAVLGGPGGASGACQAPPLVTTVAPASSPVTSPTSTSSPSPSTSPSPPSAYALTQVQLTFGPCTSLATSPATAAVVVTPAQPGAGPVQIAVAVHRWVSWCLYLWWPALAGLVLAAAFIFTMLTAGLPDPNQVRADGRAVTVRWARVWSRPLYAAGAWTFSGSWATNVTAAAAIATAVLTATGALTEIFPGVELGRFSLLIAVAGAITVMAPLVFGALNYRFLRVDPSTAGVSVISLPRGPVAVLRGRIRSVLLGCWKPAYRYGGMVVTLPEGMRARLRKGTELRLPPTTRLPPYSTVTVLGTQVPPLPYGAPATAQVTLPDGTPVRLGDRKALLPDQGEWRKAMTLAVPASATASGRPGYWLGQNHPITVPGGAKISFLGRASLNLPAGTRIAAPGAISRKPARHSSLKTTTAFPLPHSTQVIASQMWALLAASFLTLFGTGAELGILGVLTWDLAAAESLVRAVCVALIAVSAVVVFFYSVISIRALADPAPGDALNATAGTSFML